MGYFPEEMSLTGTWVHIAAKYAAAIEWEKLGSAEAIFGLCGRGQFVSGGRKTKVWRDRLAGPDGGIPVYVKRYVGRLHPYRYALRPGRAAFEARNYRLFGELGIPGPELVAVAELRQGLRLVDSIVVTREIPAVRPLSNALPGIFDEGVNSPGNIAAGMARLAARAHRHSFFHRDLRVRNVLVRPGSGGNLPEFYWIDCPRGGIWRSCRRGLAMADLRGLLKGCADALGAECLRQFMAVYDRECGWPMDLAKLGIVCRGGHQS